MYKIKHINQITIEFHSAVHDAAAEHPFLSTHELLPLRELRPLLLRRHVPRLPQGPHWLLGRPQDRQARLGTRLLPARQWSAKSFKNSKTVLRKAISMRSILVQRRPRHPMPARRDPSRAPHAARTRPRIATAFDEAEKQARKPEVSKIKKKLKSRNSHRMRGCAARACLGEERVVALARGQLQKHRQRNVHERPDGLAAEKYHGPSVEADGDRGE